MASIKGRAMVSYGPGFPLEMKEYTVPDPEPNAVVYENYHEFDLW